MEKTILDACCGNKMFWFNKNNPDVLFGDIRSENLKKTNGETLEINPDLVMDYRKMPFPDESFYLVSFDPSHRTDLTAGNWMDNYYGTLNKET